MEVRPVGAADLATIAALNDAEVPRVSPLGLEALPAHLARCELAVVAAADGAIAGFLLALGPGADYGSPNYRFFERRGDDFLYVDRVVVAPDHRRRGVAGRLYDAVDDHALATGRREVTCEVNLRPPNPGSSAFHHARGFEEVGRQDTTAGEVTVALLACPVGRR